MRDTSGIDGVLRVHGVSPHDGVSVAMDLDFRNGRLGVDPMIRMTDNGSRERASEIASGHEFSLQFLSNGEVEV